MERQARQALRRLQGGMEALESADTLVHLAAEAMAATCPRGLGAALVLRGSPARTVALLQGSREGRDVDLTAYQELFPRARLSYDRAQVQPEQRNRWCEVLRDGILRPEALRGLPEYTEFLRPQRLFEHGRVVVCLGARPLGVVYSVLPEGQPGFTEAERATLREAARTAAGAVRLASRLQGGDPASTAALDHLMARRADRSFIVASSGRVLACSPAGERLMARHPSVSRALAEVVKEAGKASTSVLSRRLGLELQVVPCAPRGSAPSYLVLVGESAEPPGRGRITARQAELLDHLAQGLTNQEIAERMGVAAGTVKTWLRRLFQRAGVSTRVALLAWAGRTRG